MRWLRSILLLLVAGRALADQTPPVSLYAPPLHSPLAAAGTGLAPEATVRVTIDPRGRVARVEVGPLSPSSDLDGEFERVLRETLLRWRYAPALQDGEPVETTLEWIVQFSEIAKQAARHPESWSFSVPSPSERRQRILSMPLERRRTMLEEVATQAYECLGAESVKKVDSPRFLVYTDGPSAETAETLASNLEATFNTLARLIGDGIDPQPEPYRIVVFMYADQASFEQLKRRVEVSEFASGFYDPAGMLAFHMQMPSVNDLLSVMLHEATHAYLDRYVAKPGVALPRWLDEGFAEYVGNSEIKKNRLIPGKTRRAVTRMTWLGPQREKTHATLGVEDVKKAIRSGEALTIEGLISAEGDEFYGDRHELYYPTAWLLVHFLHHGGEDWSTARFPTFLLYVAEGFPAGDVLRATYGDPTELEPIFRAYVQGL